ncbi:hypothetical protein [Atrimonas thermophila]
MKRCSFSEGSSYREKLWITVTVYPKEREVCLSHFGRTLEGML